MESLLDFHFRVACSQQHRSNLCSSSSRRHSPCERPALCRTLWSRLLRSRRPGQILETKHISTIRPVSPGTTARGIDEHVSMLEDSIAVTSVATDHANTCASSRRVARWSRIDATDIAPCIATKGTRSIGYSTPATRTGGASTGRTFASAVALSITARRVASVIGAVENSFSRSE